MTGMLAYSGAAAAQQVVNWLSLGSIYALLAIGIAAVFAVLGLINFAHGEVLTLSGVAMLIAGEHGLPWESFLPIAVATGCVTAVLMRLR
jgi:branched-chain amino acid transport system permease protein